MSYPLAWLTLLVCASVHGPSAAAEPPLPLPATVQHGDTLELDCGRTYQGRLSLAGLAGVTVRTRGDCGRATLTPALLVGGWQRDTRLPSVWVAPVDVVPTQLQLGERFLPLAHHPNTPGNWLIGDSKLAGQLRTRLPSADLAGATLIWRATDWLIEARRIDRYDGQTAVLAPAADHGFGLPAAPMFYVEGKRWMLDTPGEWVVDAGKLYLWPTDGQSPEGRVWASTDARAIDARGSRDVRIEGVRIFGATIAIDGSGSRGMQLTDVAIDNSGEAAIMAGSGMRVLRVAVRGTVQDGLRATDDARDVQVLDSRFDDIGMLGMPRRSRGAIVFEQAQRVIVQRNRIRNAGYLGIRVFRDALVSGNEIVRACQRLDDCAGIYTFARDRQPLHVTIDGNRVSRLGGQQAYAIYLDDFANGVRVLRNQLIDNPGGMQLHNAFDNEIVGNAFVNSQRQHILFNETAEVASIAGNRVLDNRFTSAGDVPVYRLWSHHGDRHVTRFADFQRNRYRSTPAHFAEVEGRGALAFDQWLAGIGAGDDAGQAAEAAPKPQGSARAVRRPPP